MSDISHTIVAKSDQLNAGDLFGGPVTVKVISVSINKSDQPVTIEISGDHQPFKPCLSVRRILAKLWGPDSSIWIGRSMTLYCDEKVRWAGEAIGGIRISHMTDINGKQDVAVRASSKHSIVYTILPLIVNLPPYTDVKIEQNKEAWGVSFQNGTAPASLVAKIKTQFTLTQKQESYILSIGEKEE